MFNSESFLHPKFSLKKFGDIMLISKHNKSWSEYSYIVSDLEGHKIEDITHDLRILVNWVGSILSDGKNAEFSQKIQKTDKN